MCVILIDIPVDRLEERLSRRARCPQNKRVFVNLPNSQVDEESPTGVNLGLVGELKHWQLQANLHVTSHAFVTMPI
jgi:hypothetical protein